jgi:hypothetical protein
VAFGFFVSSTKVESRQAEACPTQFLEAGGGIEPPIKVLQTCAFSLGERAGFSTTAISIRTALAANLWTST